MFSSLVVVALSLAGQVGDAGNRYPRGASPPPTTPIGSPAPLQSLNNVGPPPTAAAPRAAASAPSGNTYSPTTNTSPYAPSRPSGFGSQPTNPAFNSTSQPPPGYPSRTGALSSQPPSSPQPPSKSAIMMQAMLTPPPGNQLRGDSVSLVEVVSSGRTRNEQTQRVEAYWDLCSGVADYYLSVREKEELRSLTPAGSQQSAAFQDAKNKMAVRSDTALRAAQASQYRLAGFIGRGPGNLPLPADLPHCGSYTSRYEQVFAGRSSPEAQVLAQLLPNRYTELDDAAVGISGAEDWLRGVISRNENSDATGNLRALELLALQRRAFVQIARDYNRRIARYSELATPGQISPDRLTGMLIKRPGSSSAPAIRQSSGVDTAQERTFANTDDWLPPEKPSLTGTTKVDPAVKPASATQAGGNQEHSVVVQPQ